MVRVKRGNVARNRRKKVLKFAKGYRGGISKLYRQAHQAVLQAMRHMYVDRRDKKGDFRALWISRINAAVTAEGISYSRFIGGLKRNNIEINRKMLSELAISNPETFRSVVQLASK
ncbi:50S ribosomal protein L20 [bacterium]|nr:50S ribosomal protein L20 [bacterium]